MSFAKQGRGERTYVRHVQLPWALEGTYAMQKGHKGVGTWQESRLHVATNLTAKCEYVFVILADSNQRRGKGRGLRLRRQASSYALIESANFQGICEISQHHDI